MLYVSGLSLLYPQNQKTLIKNSGADFGDYKNEIMPPNSLLFHYEVGFLLYFYKWKN